MFKQKVAVGHLTLTCLSLLLLVNSAHTLADVAVTTLPKSSLVPGGIAVIPTNAEALSGRFKDHRIALANYNGEQYAIIGIPLNAKIGSQQFDLSYADGHDESLQFSIQLKEYAEQHLTITDIPRHMGIHRKTCFSCYLTLRSSYAVIVRASRQLEQ
jgi:hypothetical protein